MTKQLKVGASYYTEFCTQRFDTGAATDADSLPVITITKNGVDDGTSPSAWNSGIAVSGLDTGRYRVTGTVSTGYIPGDIIDICAEAVVNSVTGKGVIDEFVIISDNVYDSLIGGTDNLEVNSVEIDASGQNLSGIPWNANWDAEVQSEVTDAINVSAIGSSGEGLSGIPWNSDWDAEVQNEVNDGLLAYTGEIDANIIKWNNENVVSGAIPTYEAGTSGGLPIVDASGYVKSDVMSVEEDSTPIDGKSLAAALRYIAAICAGKISGAGTGIEVFKGLDGLTDRVTVNVDATGNRTGVTYD